MRHPIVSLCLLALATALSCGGASVTTTGSESHFLDTCSDDQCGAGLTCICGACTRTCSSSMDCSALESGTACVEIADLPNGASCTTSSAQPVCDVPCSSDTDCSIAGQTCVQGVCRKITPDLCSLPSDSGNCYGSFPEFWHNPATHQCEPFVYGGCGGNANRFDTIDACVAACHVTAVDMTACKTSGECTLANPGCCGACDPIQATDVVAINRFYSDRYTASIGCTGTACGPCPRITVEGTTRQNFGARCEAGHCSVFDVRTDALSACTADSDCTLRAGAGCCEACSGGVSAVSTSASFSEFCFAGEACDTCAPANVPGASATCSAGHCNVVYPPAL